MWSWSSTTAYVCKLPKDLFHCSINNSNLVFYRENIDQVTTFTTINDDNFLIARNEQFLFFWWKDIYQLTATLRGNIFSVSFKVMLPFHYSHHFLDQSETSFSFCAFINMRLTRDIQLSWEDVRQHFIKQKQAKLYFFIWILRIGCCHVWIAL